MAVTQALLDDAEAAYHKLITGQSVAKFRDSNGEEVTYTSTTRNALAAYIQELKRTLGLLNEGVGPMRVWF